jgi:hypothetical protein
MRNLLLLSFILVGFSLNSLASTCAQDLVDGGYANEYGHYENPINYAAYICSQYTISEIEYAKTLVDGNYIVSKENRDSRFDRAMGFVDDVRVNIVLDCGKALFDSKVDTEEIKYYPNTFTHFTNLCGQNSMQVINCAFDLVKNGQIQNKGNAYSKLAMAARTCSDNSNLIQPQEKADTVQYIRSQIQHKSVSEISLPDQTNLVMKNEVLIEGDQRCGAAKSGVRGIQCWVCQDRAKNNDRMLDPHSPRDPEKPRVMIIDKFSMPKSSELNFKIIDDGSISEVRCISQKPIVLENRNDIIQILENNDLHVVLPSPTKE